MSAKNNMFDFCLLLGCCFSSEVFEKGKGKERKEKGQMKLKTRGKFSFLFFFLFSFFFFFFLFSFLLFRHVLVEFWTREKKGKRGKRGKREKRGKERKRGKRGKRGKVEKWSSVVSSSSLDNGICFFLKIDVEEALCSDQTDIDDNDFVSVPKTKIEGSIYFPFLFPLFSILLTFAVGLGRTFCRGSRGPLFFGYLHHHSDERLGSWGGGALQPVLLLQQHEMSG